MIVAVLLTFAVLSGAVGAAMALVWRRWAARPVPVAVQAEGPTCHPRVKR